MTDELTPESLRELNVSPTEEFTCENDEHVYACARAWESDLRVKNGAINFLKREVKEVKEERDRLQEALRIACGLIDAEEGDAEEIDEILAALAATTDSQANPEKRDD